MASNVENVFIWWRHHVWGASWILPNNNIVISSTQSLRNDWDYITQCFKWRISRYHRFSSGKWKPIIKRKTLYWTAWLLFESPSPNDSCDRAEARMGYVRVGSPSGMIEQVRGLPSIPLWGNDGGAAMDPSKPGLTLLDMLPCTINILFHFNIVSLMQYRSRFCWTWEK